MVYLYVIVGLLLFVVVGFFAVLAWNIPVETSRNPPPKETLRLMRG